MPEEDNTVPNKQGEVGKNASAPKIVHGEAKRFIGSYICIQASLCVSCSC